MVHHHFPFNAMRFGSPLYGCNSPQQYTMSDNQQIKNEPFEPEANGEHHAQQMVDEHHAQQMVDELLGDDNFEATMLPTVIGVFTLRGVTGKANIYGATYYRVTYAVPGVPEEYFHAYIPRFLAEKDDAFARLNWGNMTHGLHMYCWPGSDHS